MRRAFITTVLLPLIFTPRLAASDHQTIARYLEEIGAAYYDLAAHAPKAYTCEMRSPEFVASLDANGRKAWGPEGHVVLSVDVAGLRLESAGLAQPQTKGLFDLALGIWQLRLGTELRVIEAYLPAAAASLAAAALASPLSHAAFEESTGDGRRFGLRARGPNHAIRRVVFEMGPGRELRAASVDSKDGSGLAIRLENSRTEWSGSQWLVTHVEATVRKKNGRTGVIEIALDYMPAGEDAVLLERLRVRREDEAGQPILKHKKDINPISFHFSGCMVVLGP